MSSGNRDPEEQRLLFDGCLESAKLPNRKDHEKGLQQDHGFAQAGIEVVVLDIHFAPHVLRASARTLDEITGGLPEVLVQVIHNFFQHPDLLEELQSLGKKDAVQ